MKIHHLSIEEAFASVQSRPEGLTGVEVAARLAEFGRNEVEPVRRESPLRRFLKGFTHFFALILWVAAALAFIAEAWQAGQGMLVLGWAILGVILINGTFSFWQEFRAERAFEALRGLLPQQVTVRRDGKTIQAPASSLVPGDVLFLETGERVPADCRLTEALALRVNNATVTGESVPHSREPSVSEEPDVMHSHNVLLAGTTVVTGEGTAVVFATGSNTAFGQIARLTQSAGEPLSPLQREVARLSRWVGSLALGLGAIFFVIGHVIGLHFWSNVTFAIGIIVANVPEGLLPTLTLALAIGSQRMAKRHALVRHLPAVETLGAATVICTDKTGTLTENRLTVRKVWSGGQWVDAAESTQLKTLMQGNPRLIQIARSSHNAKPTEQDGAGGWLGDPLEIALLQWAQSVGGPSLPLPRVDEIPFDSTRRRMSTVHDAAEAEGALLFTKGAPEAVLPLCNEVVSGADVAPLATEVRARIVSAQDTMAQEGLRVLALAFRVLDLRELAGCNRGEGQGKIRTATDAGRRKTLDAASLEKGLVLAGLLALDDPPRAEVPAAIRRCQESGIRVIMVTGDHAQTALSVARQIGLVDPAQARVITGDHLRRLSNVQLQLALDLPHLLFARVAADQKLRIVSALQRKHEVVAVTGDGVNDAPALKKADIGISMGRCGTDVARESADIILLDDNFATIVAAIEEGRAIYANIRKFLTYILTSNIPELVPYLAFVLFKIPLPLTIIQILAVDLGTDMVPALALGAEPPNPRTMKCPPRPAGERLLNFALIARAYLWLGVLQAVAALSAFFHVLHQGGWRYGEPLGADNLLYRQATTACLSAIIVMQVVNAFVCRSRRDSAFRAGLFSNPLILLGLAVEVGLILLIDYTRLGNAVFGTAPISLSTWLFMIPFAFGLLFLEEMRKWIMRRRTASQSPMAPGELVPQPLA